MDWVDFGIDVTPRSGGNYAMMAEFRNAHSEMNEKISVIMKVLENFQREQHLAKTNIVDIVMDVMDRHMNQWTRRSHKHSFNPSWIESGSATYSSTSSSCG